MRILENNGLSTTIYLKEDSLKKKLNYANKIELENVILIGEEKVRSNKVKIKNMISGIEITIDNIELLYKRI